MNQENRDSIRIAPTQTPWEPATLDNFEKILEQIPAPIRGIAEARVARKAEDLVQSDARGQITEEDMVDAFFAETPGGFLGPMRASMEELKIDYVKYGYE